MDYKKMSEIGKNKWSNISLELVNASGDDGISISELCEKTGKSRKYLLSFILPGLVKDGKIEKHKVLFHYFPKLEEPKEKKLTWFGKLMNRLMYEESGR